MTTPKIGTIYTLSDPRDGRIRYVGKTEKNILERLAGHLASPSNPAMRVWLNALAIQGLTPHINAIATHPVDRLLAEEEKQIQAHAAAGHRIFNSPHYHQHLTDLYPASAVTAVEALKVDEAPTSKVDQYAHSVYGPIAAACAAGEKSRVQTAAGILARVPALAAVVVWQALFGVRAIRLSLVSIGVCWWLWTCGFDHLLRDKVVAHLPVHESLRFWHEYLASPFQVIGIHALCALLLFCLFEYVAVADAAKANVSSPRSQVGSNSSPAEIASAAASALESAAAGIPPSPVVAGLTRDFPGRKTREHA